MRSLTLPDVVVQPFSNGPHQQKQYLKSTQQSAYRTPIGTFLYANLYSLDLNYHAVHLVYKTLIIMTGTLLKNLPC